MAIDFNGTTDRLNYGDVGLIEGLAEFSCCFLAKPNTGATAVFAERETGLNNDVFIVGVDTAAGDKWRVVVINDGTTHLLYSDSDATLTDYDHVLHTYDSTGTSYLYVNGVQQVDTEDTSADPTFGTWPIGGDGLRVGGYYHVANSGDDYFDGCVAEVGFWNRALSPGEASSVAATGCPRSVPRGLTFYAPLVRGDEDIVGSTSPTPEGSPVVVSHPRVLQPQAQILPFPLASGKIWLNDAPSKDGGEVLQLYPTTWTDTSITVGPAVDTTGLTGQLYLGVETADGKLDWHEVTVTSSGTIILQAAYHYRHNTGSGL